MNLQLAGFLAFRYLAGRPKGAQNITRPPGASWDLLTEA